ncbi:MAG: hypothetical protein AB1797_08195 [bacterium]
MMLDARCSIFDARSSMLVKDPVSRIEHRVCAFVAEHLPKNQCFIRVNPWLNSYNP